MAHKVILTSKGHDRLSTMELINNTSDLSFPGSADYILLDFIASSPSGVHANEIREYISNLVREDQGTLTKNLIKNLTGLHDLYSTGIANKMESLFRAGYIGIV